MTTSRLARPLPWSMLLLVLVLVLAGCGGDGAESAGGGGSPAGDDNITGSEGATPDAAGGDSTATLTVAGDEYTWTAEQMNVCEIDGIFPANADFGIPPSQGGDGPWVQFIDRGDGGINFSAVLDGEEYSGTGSGEADEIRSDGFSYTGTMGTGGESVDVELVVDC